MTVIPARTPGDVSWSAQEVVREVNDRPHLLVRIVIRGYVFPHRAWVPFVRIVTEQGLGIDCWFAEESADGRSLAGYFQTELPATGTLKFGYGNQVMGRVPGVFEAAAVGRLERPRLARDIVVVTSDYLRRKRQTSVRNPPQ